MCQLKRLTITPIFRPPNVSTNSKGPDISVGLVLTTTERCHHDELIMAHIYGLEMLRYQIGDRLSTLEEL